MTNYNHLLILHFSSSPFLPLRFIMHTLLFYYNYYFCLIAIVILSYYFSSSTIRFCNFYYNCIIIFFCLSLPFSCHTTDTSFCLFVVYYTFFVIIGLNSHLKLKYLYYFSHGRIQIFFDGAETFFPSKIL